MRFVVFGGGGDMGSRAVTELAITPGVEQITLVGRTLPPLQKAQERALAAQKNATSRSSGRGTPDELTPAPLAATREQNGSPARLELVVQDVNDADAVQRLMREHDVALGALGPFYLFEEPLVRAAIASGTDYVSLCDDGDATEAVLKYDQDARDAGVTILTGLGWTPGLTNLLVMRNRALLDKVTDVRIAWAGSASEATNGTAVVLHTMHIFHGHVVTFAQGRHTKVRAGSGSEVVEFPPPLGRIRVCHVGHPEPVTIPDHLPGVRTVSLKGGIVEPTLHTLSALTGRLGLGGTHGSRRFMAGMLQPMIPLLSRLGPRKPALSGVVVEVDGMQADHPITLRSAATAPMEALTSVPLAVGALWMAQGLIQGRGVFAPEAPGGPDPEQFLRALNERGIHVTHSVK